MKNTHIKQSVCDLWPGTPSHSTSPHKSSSWLSFNKKLVFFSFPIPANGFLFSSYNSHKSVPGVLGFLNKFKRNVSSYGFSYLRVSIAGGKSARSGTGPTWAIFSPALLAKVRAIKKPHPRPDIILMYEIKTYKLIRRNFNVSARSIHPRRNLIVTEMRMLTSHPSRDLLCFDWHVWYQVTWLELTQTDAPNRRGNEKI